MLESLFVYFLKGILCVYFLYLLYLAYQRIFWKLVIGKMELHVVPGDLTPYQLQWERPRPVQYQYEGKTIRTKTRIDKYVYGRYPHHGRGPNPPAVLLVNPRDPQCAIWLCLGTKATLVQRWKWFFVNGIFFLVLVFILWPMFV